MLVIKNLAYATRWRNVKLNAGLTKIKFCKIINFWSSQKNNKQMIPVYFGFFLNLDLTGFFSFQSFYVFHFFGFVSKY